MNNVDDILNLLKTQGIDTLDSNIPNRDKKILKNIANLISSQTYITENQGKLLVKILKENFNYIIHLDQKIKDI
jgi:GTP-sensing pleiotropic transcriptional regulator CodY